MLRALGWDHPRCMSPMRACAERWREMTGVEIDWEARSLEAFGDQPLEEAAAGYDLIVIDHPFCGRAAATRCLTPLDELLDRSALDELRAGAIGPSHDSYDYAGHQWGLATDAACQVSAVRDELLDGEPAPTTWGAVLELARRRPGAVALPLSPPHAISSWLSISAAHAAEPFADAERLGGRDRDAGRAGAARPGGGAGLGAAGHPRPADDNGRDRLRAADLRLQHLLVGGRAALPVRRRAGRRRRAPRRGARRRRPGGLRGVDRSPVRPPSSPPGQAAERHSARSSPAPAGSPATARRGTIRSSTGSPAGSTRAPARRSMARGCGRARSGGRCSSSTPGGC